MNRAPTDPSDRISDLIGSASAVSECASDEERALDIRSGVDLVEIDRIAHAMRHERFLPKLFTQREIAWAQSRHNVAEAVAGRFAAKEAISKLLGTGIRDMHWTDIEVIADPLGRPHAVLHSSAAERAREQGIGGIDVSISHTKKEAMAFAVALVWKKR